MDTLNIIARLLQPDDTDAAPLAQFLASAARETLYNQGGTICAGSLVGGRFNI